MPSLDADHRSSATARRCDCLIAGGDCLTPGGILAKANLGLTGGRIAWIDKAGDEDEVTAGRRIDATGLLVMPGIIDLHSDVIEKHIRPRPGGFMPMDIALVELDKQLAACGVTTMFHCLCITDQEVNEIRNSKMTERIAARLTELAPELSVRNRIHLRFEILNTSDLALAEGMIASGQVAIFSLMDHTPGQGQFSSLDHFTDYYSQAASLSLEETRALARRRMTARRQLDTTGLARLTERCAKQGITIASHDDDTPEKVDWIASLGARISEFPVSLAAARRARAHGIHVLMGAPNVLRGRSLTDNLSGREAIREGCCDTLGSDYSPMAMLHGVFALAAAGYGDLAELVKLVSQNPAAALGLEGETGSLQPGRSADLLLVDRRGRIPRLRRTLVAGREVYRAC